MVDIGTGSCTGVDSLNTVSSAQSYTRRGPQYAIVEELEPFIPKIQLRGRQARSWSSSRWWAQLDIRLISACIAAAVVLVTNTIGTLLLNLQSRNSNIFHGNCTTAARIDLGLHAVINILSTLLLGASNMCMQFLAAPTREEADRAHEKGHWLDIGVPSLRNLRYIEGKRRFLWWFVALSSTPLHFLYNSAFSATLPLSNSQIVVVTPDFLSGGLVDVYMTKAAMVSRSSLPVTGRQQVSPGNLINTTLGGSWGNDLAFSPSTVSDNPSTYLQFQKDYTAGKFLRRLDPATCLSSYLIPTANRSDVIVVSTYDVVMHADPRHVSNNTLLLAYGDYGFNGPGHYWMCGASNSFDCRKPDLWKRNASVVDDWNVYGYRVDYCLGSEIDLKSLCSVRLSLPIMIIICVVNAVKCICIALTISYFRSEKSPPLVTIGDAITSYLKKPEQGTEGKCLLTSADLLDMVPKMHKVWICFRLRSKPLNSADLGRPLMKKYSRQTPRWFKGASRRRWYWTISSCTLLLIVGLALLGVALYSIQMTTGSTNAFIRLGFGSLHAEAQGRMGLWDASYPLSMAYYILFANVWQFIVSTLSFQYNALLTCLLANEEWQHYGKERKALRVSWREGLQRDSYYLSLPWRYSIPQMMVFAVIHWALSQSVFVVPVELYANSGVYAGNFATLGFSVWPIITSIILGFLIIVGLVALGFRRYTGSMPLSATCSLVISAACHRPQEDTDAYLFPVQWGAVPLPGMDKQPCGEVSASTPTPETNDTPLPDGSVEHDKQPTNRGDQGSEPGGHQENFDDSTTSTRNGDDENEVVYVGHCCFTTHRDVSKPKEGLSYQ